MARHRSVSQLNTFTRCGEQYRLERVVKGLPQRPAAWTALGSAFHVAYETYENTDRRFNLDTIFWTAYNAEIEKLWELQPDENLWMKTPRVKTVEQDIKLRREHGVKQAVAYQEMCEASEWKLWRTPEGTKGLELKFSISFDIGDEHGTVEVIGAIDCVLQWPDGTVSVRDIKTGNKGNVNNRQLGLYGLALRERYGLDLFRGEYWYTKLGASGGPVDLRRYNRDYLSDQYGKLDRSIVDGLYLANPGSVCEMCGVRSYCREMGAFNG